MKIAIFTNNYLPNPYGVSGSIESFRKEFEVLGHEVYIFAPHWKGYQDENPNVFRYPAIETNIKIKFPIAIPYSRKMNKIIDKLDLDIIHSQHPNLLGSAAARWARRKNIPLVFTWHTLYDQYAHFVPFVPPKIAAWWAIRNARKYADKCNQVIVPTPSIMDILRSWGVTNKNIIAIPTGVEETDFSNPDREKIRKENGVKDDEILLALISRLTAEKNVNFLFESVAKVLRANDAVKFMVCGAGNLRSQLGEIAAREGLEEKVINIGNIERKSLKDYYSAGDIFVYASKSETQGMVFTEAMYSGLPIVAVRATGAKDIVEDGKTGFLVNEDMKEFGEAVQKLIDDENLRKKFSEEAKKVAREKYTARVCAGKLLKVYEQAIKAKNIA
jgi:glycosyltransferase involved in cell wall biosynthesis